MISSVVVKVLMKCFFYVVCFVNNKNVILPYIIKNEETKNKQIFLTKSGTNTAINNHSKIRSQFLP